MVLFQGGILKKVPHSLEVDFTQAWFTAAAFESGVPLGRKTVKPSPVEGFQEGVVSDIVPANGIAKQHTPSCPVPTVETPVPFGVDHFIDT